MSEIVELWPCPWCGGPGMVYSDDSGKHWAVMCRSDCEMSMYTDWYPNKTDAVSRWHTRAPSTLTREERVNVATVSAYESGRADGIAEAAKVAEGEIASILSPHRYKGSFGEARADQTRLIAAAILALRSTHGEDGA